MNDLVVIGGLLTVGWVLLYFAILKDIIEVLQEWPPRKGDGNAG